MGFRKPVTLYILLYHLERNYTHEYITATIIETNKKWVQATVNFQSPYDRLCSFIIKPHNANLHCLTLLSRLTVVNSSLHNNDYVLEGRPDGVGWERLITWVEVVQMLRNISVSERVSNISGLWIAHSSYTGNCKVCPILDKFFIVTKFHSSCCTHLAIYRTVKYPLASLNPGKALSFGTGQLSTSG